MLLLASIVATAIATSILGEWVQKAALFGRADYKEAAEALASAQAALKRLKEKPEGMGAARERHLKDVERVEAEVQQLNVALMSFKLKPMLLATCLQIFIFYLGGELFGGVPVLRLPYTPAGFFTNITHKGLEGDDMTQASWLFVFILTNMATKPLIAKAMGTEQPAAAAGAGGSGMFPGMGF